MEPTTPFEWQRILLGPQPPLFLAEIAIRVAIVYLAAIVILRFSGKRSRRQMTTFDWLIVIALGSAVGDVLFYPEVAVAYALVVLVTVVLLTRIVAHAQAHLPWLQDFLAGTPTILVDGGEIVRQNLRKESLSEDELFSYLREKGISDTSQVRLAYLELSGNVAVIETDEGASAPEGRSTLPGEMESR